MKRVVLSALIIFCVLFSAFTSGAIEIPSDAQMATFVTKEYNSTISNCSIYNAFPEKDCLLLKRTENLDGLTYETINKLNIDSREETIVFNPLSIDFIDLNEFESILATNMWFLNKNEIFISLKCRTLDKQSDKFDIIFYIDTGKITKLSEEERGYEYRFLNDANRDMSTSAKLKENVITVYFADKRDTEKIELPEIGLPIAFAYPGFSDSELILVVETETSIELIRWDFREGQEVKKYIIPEIDYQIPYFSSDRKYVAMFDYNHGILLKDLETDNIAHIIDSYETSLRYAPLYTSAFWSWDSEILYILSRSNLYSIKMDEINW